MGIACFFLICSIVHALGTLIEQRKPHHAYASLGSCRGCSVTSRGATPSSSPQLPLVWVKKLTIYSASTVNTYVQLFSLHSATSPSPRLILPHAFHSGLGLRNSDRGETMFWGFRQYILINQSQSFQNNLNMFQTFWSIFVQAWIAATSPLLVSILGLNLLPAAFGIMTAGQVFAINRISVAICKPTNICSLTTVCKSLFFWHFMKTCFWLKLKTLWRLINILSKGVFAMLGPPLAGALVEAAGHRGPALQVHQIFLRIC